jgi:glucose/arabinose dehydrogenase
MPGSTGGDMRRTQAAGLLFLALAGCDGVPMAVPKDLDVETVRAERLILKDRQGRTRGSMSTGEDGSAMLMLADASEVYRVTVAVGSKGSPVVLLRDAEGRPRAALTTEPDGSPVLRFTDASGKARIVVVSTAKEGPVLMTTDAEGKPAWKAP